jgi:hypothetical protein
MGIHSAGLALWKRCSSKSLANPRKSTIWCIVILRSRKLRDGIAQPPSSIPTLLNTLTIIYFTPSSISPSISAILARKDEPANSSFQPHRKVNKGRCLINLHIPRQSHSSPSHTVRRPTSYIQDARIHFSPLIPLLPRLSSHSNNRTPTNLYLQPAHAKTTSRRPSPRTLPTANK